MRLFWMELYKLMHKKITIYGGIAIMLFMGLLAFSNIQGEETAVNGVKYKGISAIRKDREITAPYKGILTDKKIKDMIDTYGFPKKVEQGYGYWHDGNYLNKFVADDFSDGYINGWNTGEYKVPTQTIPIAESDVGRFVQYAGKELEFVYYKGWENFGDYCHLGMILAGIWLIVTIAPLFAEEYQLKTSAVIFTTYHGRKQHITAKILASFAVTFTAYLSVMLSGVLFYGCTYGFEGANMLYFFIDRSFNYYCKIPIYQIIITFAAVLFVAMLMTAAFSIWISAKAKTSYQAVVNMLLLFVLPLLPALLFSSRLVTFLIGSMPLGHMMIELLTDTWGGPMILQLIIAAVLITGCVVSGPRIYRNIDKD